MERYFTVIDEKKRLGSCMVAKIPEGIAELIQQNIEGYKLGELTFFYDEQNDYIVMNEENKLFEMYRSLVLDLLECTDTQLLEMVPDVPDSIRNAISIVSYVIRKRNQSKDVIV